MESKGSSSDGGSAPSVLTVAIASTQTGLLKGETAVQNSDCRKQIEVSPGAGTAQQTCLPKVCQVEELLWQVAELQEAQHSIRVAEKELYSWFSGVGELLPNAVCSGPKAHGQTAKTSPTGTHRREGEQ